ncbi:MAG: phosphoenolpyruvate--protein phosphotransferase, partial [Nocardioidaceae bacterium]
GADGVLVLVDLGSAVLRADMALEFVAPETAARVTISSAPLVEGLVAAMVVAATGAALDAVAAEAGRGLAGKQAQLDQKTPGVGGIDDEPVSRGGAADGGEAVADAGTAPDQDTVELMVANEHGLHARPAARLVALVAGFDAQVTVTNLSGGGGPVDAASISLVATLNVRRGDRIEVAAAGPERSAALDAVTQLAGRNFGDGPSSPSRQVFGEAEGGAGAARQVFGEAEGGAGSGLDVAIGPAVVADQDVDLSGYDAGAPEAETTVGRSAGDEARRQLERLIHEASSAEQADIFGAHLALAGDPAVVSAMTDLAADGHSAPDSWSRALGDLEQRFAELDDPYQRERAEDVRSVRRRVLSVLMGLPPPDSNGFAGNTRGILVIPELDAATAATLDETRVIGVITTTGGATGHGVIVATSRGIPIITGVGAAVRGVRNGDVVAFDARAATVLVRPNEEQRQHIASVIERRSADQARAAARATESAVTRDGLAVDVTANVGSEEEARAARAAGADGSGLVRTELVFGHLAEAPGATEQAEVFVALAEALGGRPVTIRSWDVGGDKPLAFLPAPRETNPFLGFRGLRLMRLAPDVFQQQLEAIWLAARTVSVRVMFPMVSTLDDVDWALEQLSQARHTVVGSGASPPLEVGIMVEVPAAVAMVGQLAARLDFVSIGTNDLAQYVMAAERGNAALAALADPLQPAVLRSIAQVCAAMDGRVDVAMCGGLASDPSATALLVGLGVRELSVVAPRVAPVKEAVRATDLASAQRLTVYALQARSPADVREYLSAESV